MVNENQIVPDKKFLTHQAAELFIEDESFSTSPPELYNLEEEYSKTKRNKNGVIWLTLPLFIILSLAAAYIVTKYIEDSSSRVPISIDAFEDVNLREIFDKAKKHEKDMQKAVRDLEDLYIARDKEREDLENEAEREINIIEADGKDVENRTYIVKSNLEVDLKANSEKWEILINEAKDKIDEIQDKIDSYDTRIMEKAKEQESIINNQQKRFDIEMEETVKYYEERINELVESHTNELKNLDETHKAIVNTINKNNEELVSSLEGKYNPEFDATFNFLNSETEGRIKIDRAAFRPLDIILYREGILEINSVVKQRNDFLQGDYTFKELKKVPYYNSPEKAIIYLENLYKQNMNEYVELIKRVVPVLKEKNSIIEKREGLIESQERELSRIDFFLTDYVKKNRINGIIIDPREEGIKLFVDPIYRVKSGTLAFVFRNDSDYIGTITLHRDGEGYKGKISALANPKRGINPFDMILLDIE